MYSIDVWQERNRQYVILYRGEVGDDIVDQWWDDDVEEMVEQGLLNPRDWLGSAVEYCRSVGIIKD